MTARPGNPAIAVTAREAEVLDAIGRRLLNPEIAAELFISVRTVESHVASLLRKLEATDRSELISAALQRRRRSGLPETNTSFVGRRDELAIVRRRLESDRIVTITGPAGCGKTRLAVEAMRDNDVAVAFLDVASVDTDQLDHSVAEALAIEGGAGDPVGRIAFGLAQRQGIIVLDNCEVDLTRSAALVRQLGLRVPTLSILATSRQPLGVNGESLLRLQPLSISAAHELFLERASRAGAAVPSPSDHALVNEICERVDGLPLAVELAAARLPAFGLRALTIALHEDVDVLRGPGRAERHRTLASAVGWSLDQLTTAELTMLQTLAVLPDGLAIDEIAALTSNKLDPEGTIRQRVASLAERSLVALSAGDGSDEVRLLQTIRSLALDEVDDDTSAAVTAGLVDWSVAQLTNDVQRARFDAAHQLPRAAARQRLITALNWASVNRSHQAGELAKLIGQRFELDPSAALLIAVRDAVSLAIDSGEWSTDAYAWSGILLNYFDLGEMGACALAARDHAVSHRDRATADWVVGFWRGYVGDEPQAVELLRRARRWFHDHDDRWMVGMCEMGLTISAQDLPTAAQHARDAVVSFAAIGAARHANAMRVMLIRRLLAAGTTSGEVPGLLAEAHRFAEDFGSAHDVAHALAARAEHAHATGAPSDVELATDAAERFRRVGDLRCLARSLRLLATSTGDGREKLTLTHEVLHAHFLLDDIGGQIDALHTIEDVASGVDNELAALAAGACVHLEADDPLGEKWGESAHPTSFEAGRAAGPRALVDKIGPGSATVSERGVG